MSIHMGLNRLRVLAIGVGLVSSMISASTVSAQLRLNGINCNLTPRNLADDGLQPAIRSSQETEWTVSNPFGAHVTNKDVDNLPGGVWQHTGVDYLAGRSSRDVGQPIYAVANGVVVFSTASNPNPNPSRGGLVIIRHVAAPGQPFRIPEWTSTDSNQSTPRIELYTYYLHLNPKKPLPKQGDQVTGGQKIAETYTLRDVRTEGFAYTPHLHLEVWRKCSDVELNGYERVGRDFEEHLDLLADPVSVLAANPSVRAALNMQMTGFLSAVRSSEARGFQTFFSSSQSWRYVLNISGVDGDARQAEMVTPAQLRRDLTSRGKFYSYFLDPSNRGVGSVGSYAEAEGSWMLVAGNKFVPPGHDVSSPTWVRWRLEEGKWVIAEIAEYYH